MRKILALIFILANIPLLVYAQGSSPAQIPDDLYAQDKIFLASKRTSLLNELDALNALIKSHDAKCGQVEDDNTALIQECTSEMGSIQAKVAQYQKNLADYNNSLNVKIAAKSKEYKQQTEAEQIQSKMIEELKNLPWTAKEKERAELALTTLEGDGDAASTADIVQIWKDIQARRNDAVLAQEAAQGTGPGLPGAGNQTIHEDCAIFALANVGGVPYEIAAARATKFISEGHWRTAEERANPQEAIEKHGLMGGEVILVAEALGQVDIVPSWKFTKTLQEGRPVMVNLVPYSGSMRSGHEVVLTKTFQHDGITWFEMIDSNEAGAMQRLYVNEKELGMMLKENGVAFYPEHGTVPELLR